MNKKRMNVVYAGITFLLLGFVIENFIDNTDYSDNVDGYSSHISEKMKADDDVDGDEVLDKYDNNSTANTITWIGKELVSDSKQNDLSDPYALAEYINEIYFNKGPNDGSLLYNRITKTFSFSVPDSSGKDRIPELIDISNYIYDNLGSGYSIIIKDNKQILVEIHDGKIIAGTEDMVSDTVDQSQKTYNYEAIEGHYAFFDGEAYNSNILITIIIEEDRFIEIVPSWNEILVYDISTKTVVNDTMNINYERTDPYSGEFESNDISAIIQKLDNKVVSLSVNGDDYIKLTAGQIEAYGMELPSHLNNFN
ncbi:MAG: hypothetical protein ACTHVE_11155 [Senegalia sp. (in: firmicutes)]|uniref:hypothetical protein n=1 Tax=Senegalia sp. (in: firmicutes) TaxID=1924098 RepID=UPI003F973550